MPLEQRVAALTLACRLAQTGSRAQRRLDELQRPKRPQHRAAVRTEQAAPEPAAPEPAVAASAASPAIAEAVAADEAAPAKAAPLLPDVTEAEKALKSAEKLLRLMKAHWKGAPPPHSPAAQQIQAQERAVNMARMTLAQARKRQADAARAADAVA